MDIDHRNSENVQAIEGDIQQPQAISLDRVAEIASEVQDLVKTGRESSAWELIRRLHPADMGSIVASLPRASRDAMVRVMSPETVAWMLRQMLTFILSQVHPNQALATLRRIPFLRPKEVAESLERPLAAEDIIAHEPDSAGSLMVTQLPTVYIDGLAEAARERLRELIEIRDKLTHVYAVRDNGDLVGQISMVDLALADNATPIRTIARSTVATVDG